MNKEIEIGCEAKHLITEVVGIVTGVSESLNGSIQYGLKPNGTDKEGKPFEEYWLDAGILERTGEGLIGKVPIVTATQTDIKLGMTVEHFNGFVGVATERVHYFNGCVHFGLMPTTADPNVMPDTKYVPSQYLSIKLEAEPVTTEADDNGGPSSGAPLMM
jgi:hypothetical protein